VNEWDGVIAVEQNETIDKRRIVAEALVFEDVLPVMTAASLSEDDADRLKGKTTRVWREGKFIKAEGCVDAPPGTYAASVAVSSKGHTLFRVHEDTERGTYTILSGDVMEVVLIPVDQAVWPEASITVYDGANPNTGEARVRRLLELMDTWLANGVLPKHYRDDELALSCEHGEPLHVGWRELNGEALRAQALLDHYAIPGGYPQGKGDLDWRVAEALLELSETRSLLSDIAAAHRREEVAGMVGDFCVECTWRWPCPTYLRASRQRSSDRPWHPLDDEDGS
jgi:hypothetical protein